MMRYNFHLCFDLDGTLIDSFPLMKESWENVNKILHLKVGWEQYKVNIGLHFDEICRNLGLEHEKKQIQSMYFEYNKNNIDKIHLMPGVRDLMKEIKKREITWSIITSKPRYTADDILKHFQLDPEILICSDDVSNGKPDTEASKILNDFYKDKNFDSFYYIGDAIVDHLFAINSGYKYIQFRQNSFEGSIENKAKNLRYDSLVLNPRPIIKNISELLLHLKMIRE